VQCEGVLTGGDSIAWYVRSSPLARLSKDVALRSVTLYKLRTLAQRCFDRQKVLRRAVEINEKAALYFIPLVRILFPGSAGVARSVCGGGACVDRADRPANVEDFRQQAPQLTDQF
jgi:hypothetical protein